MNVSHVLSYRHFCNKIWQSFKFIQHNLGPEFVPNEQFKVKYQLNSIKMLPHNCVCYVPQIKQVLVSGIKTFYNCTVKTENSPCCQA